MTPKAVEVEVDEAVRRWRWRNVAEKHASLPPAGANFDPLHKLMNSKKKNAEWGPAYIGELKSVVANRQFPQLRCFSAGWTQHGRCIFCLHEKVTGCRVKTTMPAVPQNSSRRK